VSLTNVFGCYKIAVKADSRDLRKITLLEVSSSASIYHASLNIKLGVWVACPCHSTRYSSLVSGITSGVLKASLSSHDVLGIMCYYYDEGVLSKYKTVPDGLSKWNIVATI
jgi:hypothetical protein